jgi:hypothetical protein
MPHSRDSAVHLLTGKRPRRNVWQRLRQGWPQTLCKRIFTQYGLFATITFPKVLRHTGLPFGPSLSSPDLR